jgi:uncharacterized membrane protein YkvA (DUF1232 family)
MTQVGSLGQRLARLAKLLSDPRTPKLPKLALLLAVIYALWPLDLLPDFAVPVLGYLDDLVVAWLALRWLGDRGGAAVDGPAADGEPRAQP